MYRSDKTRLMCRIHDTIIRDCACATSDIQIIDCINSEICQQSLDINSNLNNFKNSLDDYISVKIKLIDMTTRQISGIVKSIHADGFVIKNNNKEFYIFYIQLGEI